MTLMIMVTIAWPLGREACTLCAPGHLVSANIHCLSCETCTNVCSIYLCFTIMIFFFSKENVHTLTHMEVVMLMKGNANQE